MPHANNITKAAKTYYYGNPDLTNRAYTGHEHLPDYQLINMNGRMYDPISKQMTSPDILDQSTYFTQSYSRYSYGLNNPMSYTDSSGYWWRKVTYFTEARIIGYAKIAGWDYLFPIDGFIDHSIWINYSFAGFESSSGGHSGGGRAPGSRTSSGGYATGNSSGDVNGSPKYSSSEKAGIALSDRDISAGDVFRIGLSAGEVIFPTFGLVYGAIDMGTLLATGTSLTDNIGEYVDYHY